MFRVDFRLVVTDLDLTGSVMRKVFETPAGTLAGGGSTEYTGTVSWNPSDDPLVLDKAYTATVNATVNAGGGQVTPTPGGPDTGNGGSASASGTGAAGGRATRLLRARAFI